MPIIDRYFLAFLRPGKSRKKTEKIEKLSTLAFRLLLFGDSFNKYLYNYLTSPLWILRASVGVLISLVISSSGTSLAREDATQEAQQSSAVEFSRLSATSRGPEIINSYELMAQQDPQAPSTDDQSGFMLPPPPSPISPSLPPSAPASVYPSPESRYRSLEMFSSALYHLSSMYVDPQSSDVPSLVYAAMWGMVERLDPHTVLMSPEMFERLHDFTKGQYGGVGLMVVHKKQYMLVVSVVPNSPAQRQGIMKGDRIIAIDGLPLSPDQGSSMGQMRGLAGSEITLTVVRDHASPKDITMHREVVRSPSVFPQQLSSDIAYIKITNFQEDTAIGVEDYLKKHRGSLGGLIIDLRDNPGGLLEEAVKICDLLLTSGVIVSTIGRDPHEVEREYAFKKGTFSEVKVMVLVNSASASASEIVAGAVQDHHRGLVLGEKTFGKGSVQTLVSLPDGGGLKVTIARYYTPRGRSIQSRGISPDISLPYDHRSSAAYRSSPRSDDESDTGESENRERRHDGVRGGVIEDKRSSLTVLRGDKSEENLKVLSAELPRSWRQLISKWPSPQRDDQVLSQAFVYLNEWQRLGPPTS